MDEVAAVLYDDGQLFGFFWPEDARRVGRWLENEGNERVRVVVGPIGTWPSMPHDDMRRVEIRTRRRHTGPPSYQEFCVNDSLAGEPRWERRDDGRLIESLAIDELRAKTEAALDSGLRVIQWLA